MDVRMPDGTIITNVPEGTTKAQLMAKLGQATEQPMTAPQTLHTEDTIYDPVSGLPLSSPSYGPEAQGGVKTAQKGLTAAAAMPIQYAASTAKPIAGISQLVGKLFGSQTAEEPARALNQIQTGLGQVSPSSKVAGFAGEVLNPLTLAGANTAMGMANKLPALPSYAKNVLGGLGAGAVVGATEPTQTGLSGEDFAKEKVSQIGTNAALGGAIPAVAPALKGAGKAVSEALGVTTGAGGESVRQAYKAGAEGGAKAKAFAENLREQVAKTDVLDDVSKNLEIMRNNLSNQYRSGMMDISADKSLLSFDKIDEALSAAKDVGRYKGQVKNKEAAKVVQEATDAVNKWKKLDPAEYHTPEGLDALKQQIGGILESIPFEQKTARKAVHDIYSAVRKEIADQAPTYSKVMKDYSEGAELLGEIKKTFSQGGNASVDTQMRKLQSLMRNNVNTNYGNRQALMQSLEEQGGREVMPALAGQALSSATPRGLAGLGPVATTVGALSSGNLAPLALLPLESPRVVGEAAFGAGKLANAIKSGAKKTPLGQLSPNELKALSRMLVIQSGKNLGE